MHVLILCLTFALGITATAISARAETVTIVDSRLVPTTNLESVAQAWVKAGGNAAKICPPLNGPVGRHDLNGGQVVCHQQDTSAGGDSAQADAVAQTVPSIITDTSVSAVKVTSAAAVAYAASGNQYTTAGSLKSPRTSMSYGGLMVSAGSDPIDGGHMLALTNLPRGKVNGDLFKLCAQLVGSDALDELVTKIEKETIGVRATKDDNVQVFALVAVALRSNGDLKVVKAEAPYCANCPKVNFFTSEDFEDACAESTGQQQRQRAPKPNACKKPGMVIKQLKKPIKIDIEFPEMKQGDTITLNTSEVACSASKKAEKKDGKAR